MLDIAYIREHPQEVERNARNRGRIVDINKILDFDARRSECIQQVDALRSKQNSQKGSPTPDQRIELGEVKSKEAALTRELESIEKQLHDLLSDIPNITHADVHISSDEDDNPVLDIVKNPNTFDFTPKDHVTLGVELDCIDFDRATKVSGAKFYYLKNDAVLLEQALINYAFQVAIRHGYTPVSTPDIAKRHVLEEVGFNPRGEATQVYNIENTDLSLIGTAEITMSGYHMDETFDEKDLPKKYVALSHCFRTEAGSYSKYAKGIFRVHQFTKVEMFQYVLPTDSESAHQEMLTVEKELFSGLDLPYRVIDHSTADLGNPAYRTFDLEAWMPGKPNKDGSMGDWAEVTSTSNCTDYQSRGLHIKYKTKDGTKAYVHMLNGTAFAIPRVIIAILENNQRSDGSVVIPKVLVPFMGKEIITNAHHH